MSYEIIPLVLSRYVGEKGFMTYMLDYGKPIVRPFVMWYIKGLKQNILVDTAIEAADYRTYHPKFKNLDFDALMSFEEALESVNLSPDKIDIVIQTHLHFDHCYNTRKCVNAKVLVQKDELDFLRNPKPFEGLYRSELLEGLSVEAVAGDRLLFEGLHVLYTPGHTAGGQAVSVSTEKGKAVISGLCGIKENFFPTSESPMAGDRLTILPGIMLNAVQAYHSLLRIKSVADIILPLHDPGIMDIKKIP